MDTPFSASRATFVQKFQEAQASDPPARLVVTVEHEPSEHFVQFLFWDATTVIWEVGTYRGTSFFGKPHVFLTAEQQALLQARGFRYQKESPNYMRVEQLAHENDYQQIVEESCELLATVYHCNPNSRLCFTLIQ
jgi:hypothetical protein